MPIPSPWNMHMAHLADHRIESPRLVLDALQPDDALALFACRGDPEVARYQGWQPASVNEATDFIARNATVAFAQPDAWCQLAIRCRDTAALIGDFGIHFPASKDEAVELGISLLPAQQGKGYAREAMRAVIGHLFAVMGYRRVIGSVDPRNTSSVALLRALGLRQEAHHRQSLHWRGQWADDMIFAVLASEWPPTRSLHPSV